MVCLRLGLVAVAFAAGPRWSHAGEWPQFRGSAAGVSTESSAPLKWSMDDHIAWKVQVPGVAWSSPIVWGDRVFLATAVSDKQTRPRPFNMGGGGGPEGGRNRPPGKEGGGPPGKEGRPPGKPLGGRGGMGGGKPPDAVYRWEVHCLDRTTGKTLWSKVAAERKPTYPIHPTNTYASETPVTDGERVYVYFGMTGVFCYDFNGKLVWQKELGSFPLANGFGAGSSPTLHEGRLFVQCDNEEKSFLVALKAETGEELWRVDRPSKTSWGTPYIWRNRVRTELVALGSDKVRSYDPATGKLLWELGGTDSSFTASPAGDADILCFGTSGPMSVGPLWGVKAGASGDITLAKGEKANEFVAWYRTRSGPGMSSPLIHDGLLYIIARSAVYCFDVKTGEPVYEPKRLPGARGVTAAPLLVAGKLYIVDEDGQTFIVQAGREFKILGQNKLEDGMFWSSPAMVSGQLLIRGTEHLFSIRD